jgi:hypothetical protein
MESNVGYRYRGLLNQRADRTQVPDPEDLGELGLARLYIFFIRSVEVFRENI